MEEDDDEWLILLYPSGTDTLCDRDPGKSFAEETEDQILRTCAIRRGGFQYPIGFMITVS
jgi:hypothetical protein